MLVFVWYKVGVLSDVTITLVCNFDSHASRECSASLSLSLCLGAVFLPVVDVVDYSASPGWVSCSAHKGEQVLCKPLDRRGCKCVSFQVSVVRHQNSSQNPSVTFPIRRTYSLITETLSQKLCEILEPRTPPQQLRLYTVVSLAVDS